LYKTDVLGLNAFPIIIGDVETLGLSFVLLESLRTDGSLLLAVAAVVASAAAASRGFVLFIFLQLLQPVLDLVGPVLRVLCVISSAASALISLAGVLEGFVKAGFEEAEGGGQVFGIVEEDIAVSWSCGFKDHRGSARRERNGEWCWDQLRDVFVVVPVGERDVVCFVGGIVPVEVLEADSLVLGDLIVGLMGGCCDGGEVFDTNETVGHCEIGLVEEVEEEVVVVVGVVER
jgi:hypothetical protein